jgi:hypothetical protein
LGAVKYAEDLTISPAAAAPNPALDPERKSSCANAFSEIAQIEIAVRKQIAQPGKNERFTTISLR